MNAPAITIILANLNGRDHLDPAFRSVQGQNFSDWELLVVDSGSTDGSRECIQSWVAKDDRIKHIFTDRPFNYPSAVNLGLTRTSAPFVARLESDDMWLPNRLERQIAFLGNSCNNQVGVCGSDVLLIDEWDRVVGHKRFPRTHEECAKAIWYRNPLCHSAVLARREVFSTCGLYNENFYLVEDLELWFRVSKRWELANLSETLVKYRVWSGSLTARRAGEIARLTREVRKAAARASGTQLPPAAFWVYWGSYAAAFLPPSWTRWLFHVFIRQLSRDEKATEWYAAYEGANRRAL